MATNIVTVTSNIAHKMIKNYEDELQRLERIETKSIQYSRTQNEGITMVRPNYNFKEVEQQYTSITQNIRNIKYAIHSFNQTTMIDSEGDMTIAEALVYLPQLNRRIARLASMCELLPAERNGYRDMIEYTYINFDQNEVKEELNHLRTTLNDIQTKLDTLNNTVTFEIRIVE